jgi:hypothetical protein
MLLLAYGLRIVRVQDLYLSTSFRCASKFEIQRELDLPGTAPGYGLFKARDRS